ncbi:hypothetical protein SAMN05720473_11240 [Fibrobacter sp. UWB15]|nr:hypothetical protein BGW99_11340 [Fibrobacter sp. UWB6]SHG54555.1 hypothetical protein SAMN05720760_11428 [Fibrobacter sp. UWB8]SMG41460.1 hypothetical protein SAMN05720473_11240 [Fibrobacter sp. UWB15]
MMRFCTKLLLLMNFSLAILCACGDVVETEPNYYKCSDNSKISGYAAEFGNYKVGKTIPYKHSDGYLFSLAVIDRDNYIDDVCTKHLNTILESAYPIYTISLSAETATFYYNEDDKLNQSITVKFGQYIFSLRNPERLEKELALINADGKDSLAYVRDSSYIEKMEINGVAYADVAVAKGRKYEQPYKNDYQTNTVESSAKLYYQTKKGILKIEMEDGSYIAINEEDD